MHNTNNDAAVAAPDTVTISEARQRLGESAPGRHAFYAAINNGRLSTTEPDPETGKIRLPWSAVESFVTAAVGKVRLPKKSVMAKPGRRGEKTDKLAASEPSPLAERAEGDEMGPHGTDVAKPSPSSPSNGVTHARSLAVGAKKKKEGKRRLPHLRELKNNLRHLDFEQTKSIRDWADNRLLNVLHRDLKSSEIKEASANQKEH